MSTTQTVDAGESAATKANELAGATASARAGGQPDALAALLGTGDHRTIGKLFIGFACVFGLIGLAVGSMVGFEHVTPATDDLLGEGLAELFTLHRTTVVFLFLMPALIGIATAIVPLQVGARSIAFPRASALAFWSWLVSGAIVLFSFFAQGGPAGRDLDAVTLWAVAMAGVVISLLVASTSIATTVLAARAPGMGVMQVPAFSWSMLVTAALWILTLPVLLANLVLFWFDVTQGNVIFSSVSGLEWFGWIYSQPASYIVLIPVLGIAADIVPVAAGSKVRSHGIMLLVIGLFGANAFGAYAQPALDGAVTERLLYIVMSVEVLLVVLAFAGLLADTLKSGSPKASGGLVPALLAVVAALAATLVGTMSVIDPFELGGTAVTEAHFTLVTAAAIAGIIAAATYWSPKLSGVRIPDGVASGAALVVVTGGIVAGAGYLIAGFADVPAFPTVEDVSSSGELFNTIGLIGTVILTLGTLAGAAAVARCFSGSADDGAAENPHDGFTLEWLTASPPAQGNFAELPVVSSATPLLDDSASASIEEAGN